MNRPRSAPTTPKHVQDADRFVRAFGRWSTFHDAELWDVRHDETGSGAVTFALLVFKLSGETDEQGYFRHTAHHVVRFRFEGVAEVSIATRDDTLDLLAIADELGDDGRFAVHLESVCGLPEEGFGGSFRARSGFVVDVVPTDAGPCRCGRPRPPPRR